MSDENQVVEAPQGETPAEAAPETAPVETAPEAVQAAPAKASFSTSLIVPLKLKTTKNSEAVEAMATDQVGKVLPALGEGWAWDGKFHRTQKGVQAVNLTKGEGETIETKEFEIWCLNVSQPGIEYFFIPADREANEGFKIVGSKGHEYGLEGGQIGRWLAPRAPRAQASSSADKPARAPRQPRAAAAPAASGSNVKRISRKAQEAAVAELTGEIPTETAEPATPAEG